MKRYIDLDLEKCSACGALSLIHILARIISRIRMAYFPAITRWTALRKRKRKRHLMFMEHSGCS